MARDRESGTGAEAVTTWMSCLTQHLSHDAAGRPRCRGIPRFVAQPAVGKQRFGEIPLADGLFSIAHRAIADQWSGMDAILPYLRHVPDGASVEETLDGLRDEAVGDPVRARHLMAVRFYLQHLITVLEDQWRGLTAGVTNHVTLFDELRRLLPPDEPISVVTYNYDRMVERTFERLGVVLPDFGYYTSDPRWRLYKVHGSTDWVRPSGVEIPEMQKLDGFSIARATIATATEITAPGPIQRWTGGVPVSADLVPMIPAIAVPYKTKQVFELPDEHLKALKETLPGVTRMLVIGWRAVDPPFLDLLREAQPSIERLIIVSRSDPSKTMSNISSGPKGPAFVPSVVVERPGGFTEYILSRLVREDLS